MSSVIQGLFGNTAASQSGGLFGAAQTSTATGFGTGTGLFGQTNTGFGNVGTQVQTRDDLRRDTFTVCDQFISKRKGMVMIVPGVTWETLVWLVKTCCRPQMHVYAIADTSLGIIPHVCTSCTREEAFNNLL